MLAEKNEFLTRVEDQLGEMRISIQALQKKLENAAAADKPDLARRLEAMEKRFRSGVARLQDLTETSDYVWEGIQDELEAFWNELTA